MNKPRKKLLVMAGYKCNNNCVFCSAESFAKSRLNRSTGEIAAQIIANGKKYRTIEFIGGEFTIRKDAIYLIALAKKSGYDFISLETNGRMFANKNFCKKAAEAGLSLIVFSIHGSDARTHDALTRAPGSFDQAIAGIKNLSSYPEVRIKTNFVITKKNYRQIPAFVKKMKKITNIEQMRFSFIRPVNLSDAALEKMMPDYSRVMPFLKKVENEEVKFQFIPLCMAGPKRFASQEAKKLTRKNYGQFESEIDLFKSLSQDFVRPKVCDRCAERESCLGIPGRYLALRGEGELKPISCRLAPFKV